jgi:heptosyltransferase-2
VGDAILSLPLLAELARHGSSIDVLTSPVTADVYRCSPHVRNILTEDFRHGQLQMGLRRQIARSIKGHYQMAVVLPHSFKSALIPWLAGIPVRRGMRGEYRFGLLNDLRLPGRRPAERDQDQTGPKRRASMLDYYLQLADNPIERLDASAQAPEMQLPLDPGLASSLQASWTQGLMVLCPGAEYGPAKQWPADKFAAVAAAWLAGQTQRHVVILGSSKDKAFGDEIQGQVLGQSEVPKLADRIQNLSGQTRLLDAFAWIAKAQWVVSNDSGLMHAAAAFKVPLVAIFGSTDPRHTPPHSPRAHIMSLGLSCSPCFKRVCPLGTTACLKELPADRVIRLIDTAPDEPLTPS